ncbi:MAG: selenocysteine-specific translation elongation factor [Acidobacteria bacterium]|nr:selenocysteine-specific translation elongation factor [Acidobacteriota bacterium]
MPGAEKDIRHVIIGTAGHIDHGKTALVKALTGIDADSLKEEKKRGITIELGFVFMDTPLPDRQVVFIDVPGHEKLIKTMVAGASNIDAVLLVIAADEGISLQTREHFDILRILDISGGLIVLTKADLVDDDRLTELREEVGRFTEGSFLEDAPVLAASALTGKGIEDLRTALLAIARQGRIRRDSGIFRMPVDRVFTMQGFGTVIAGTVLSGTVQPGDEIMIFPDELPAKIRGVQVHHEKKPESHLGKRTALNLTGVKKEQIKRGQTAAAPGSLIPTLRLDARLALLPSAPPLKNRTRLRLHTGTSEIICRIHLLAGVSLEPGGQAVVQFILEAPTAALPEDRFVVRTFSPLMTIGGGRILDAALAAHKRRDAVLIDRLNRLGDEPVSFVEYLILESGSQPLDETELQKRTGLSANELHTFLANLRGEGRIRSFGTGSDSLFLHGECGDDLKKDIEETVTGFLRENTGTLTMTYNRLRALFVRKTHPSIFSALLQELLQAKRLHQKGDDLSPAGYEIQFSEREEKLAAAVEKAYLEAGFSSPLEQDVRLSLNIPEETFRKIASGLFSRGTLLRIDPKVTYHRRTFEEIQKIILQFLGKHSSITIARLRDELKVSRKYGQAILEHLDETGVTRRVGDEHVPA